MLMLTATLLDNKENLKLSDEDMRFLVGYAKDLNHGIGMVLDGDQTTVLIDKASEMRQSGFWNQYTQYSLARKVT